MKILYIRCNISVFLTVYIVKTREKDLKNGPGKNHRTISGGDFMKDFVRKMMVMACAASLAMAQTAFSETEAISEDVQTIGGADAPASILLVGGWEINSGALSIDDEENKDAKEAFEKATDGLEGYEYEPIAVLGSQVVAGTNYSILCRGTVIVPDAEPVFEIITVYEDLDGNAEIIGDKEIFSGDSDAQGGYTVNEGDVSFEKNEDVKTAFDKAITFDKALESLEGADYEPVAYLGSQTVAGINYMALMRVTAVTPETLPEYDLVTVYQDLDGNAEITDMQTVTIDAEDAVCETETETED